MLTDKQLQNLEPFNKHEKFGKLISNAVENWKKSNQYPIRCSFGIISDGNNRFTNITNTFDYCNMGCCLIGSSLINKNCHYSATIEDEELSACKEYNIEYGDVYSLIAGFDGSNYENGQSFNKEAYDIGKKIGEIVFND